MTGRTIICTSPEADPNRRQRRGTSRSIMMIRIKRKKLTKAGRDIDPDEGGD